MGSKGLLRAALATLAGVAAGAFLFAGEAGASTVYNYGLEAEDDEILVEGSQDGRRITASYKLRQIGDFYYPFLYFTDPEGIAPAPGSPGAGCKAQSATVVRCLSLIIILVEMRGGDGADVLNVSIDDRDAVPKRYPFYLYGFGGKDELRGGKGDDGLTGMIGNDLLLGRAGSDELGYLYINEPGFGTDTGKDTFLAGAGSDLRIDARDGTKDAEINCGTGDDGETTVYRDGNLDPAPISC